MGSKADERSRWQRIGGITAGVLVVAAVGVSRLFGDVPAERAPDCDQPVAWQQAAEVTGEAAAVAGPVVDATHAPEVGGEPTFLNLGAAHPDPERFDVVIYAGVREQFAEPPEERFTGQTVCVLGDVRLREGVPQVILPTAASITVIGS